ncbi:MAG: SCO family protein [Polyangiaceae bacterium]
MIRFAKKLIASFVLGSALGVVAMMNEPTAFAHDDAPAQKQTEAQGAIPAQMQHVGVNEHLDAPIPLEAHFKDQDGQNVVMGDYFGKKPIALILAYHTCPVLCGMIQHAAATSFKELADNKGWVVGKQFDVVVLSIDPTDTPEVAKKKKDEIVAAYGHPESANGFHYLVGEKAEIDRVANAVGFEYQYDEAQKQYAHPAVLMLVKPGGEMARYLYGLAFESQDLKFGLLEASEGRSISTVDRVILYCYHYDPHTGKYAVVAARVMQIGAGFSAVALGLFLFAMWRLERRRTRDTLKEERSKPIANRPASPKQATETP